MERRIIDLLGRPDYLPLNVPELLRELRLPPPRQQELQALLRDLEQSGRVARIKGNRYIIPREADLIPGRIRMNRAGKGFLQPDDPALKEIAIPESATGTALHEDRVLVRREVQPRGIRRDTPAPSSTGSVVRILERRRTQIVGTLQRGREFLYVIPDDPRIGHDIYVPTPRDVGRPANFGDKVVVELLEWESRHTSPQGEIIEVLGAPDEEGVDMLSVLRQYDLPLHFPKIVLQEARSFGATISEADFRGRVDCRRHSVITIDPDDAKDFDDAICLERNGANWTLWVHIADVSHYVKPGTALDTEARKRGNSTYLVDRVIPMLPEALSNELCSLKPAIDRLTKCVEFLIANDGRVLSTKFYSAVIHSQRRFSYQEAFAIIQRPPASPIEQMLHHAHELAQRIRRARFKAGALELDFPEMKIRLDERGRVARIEKVENDVSHQLIEEYMLLANEAVATRLMSEQRPTVYRVHEEPDQLRLEEYREEVLSHNVPCGNLSKRSEVQRLLQKLNTIPIGAALKIGFLKSLMRARYAVEPLGHYGLAKKKYTHFTSPIRRYSDLIVHRSLFDQKAGSFAVLAQAAEHISMTERNSADAERDSKDVKLFAFLNAQLRSGRPEHYPALVTGVRNFGFFVDVPGLVMSGLVPLSSVEDDFYVFEPDRNHLIGRRSRRIIRLGDKVTVQVAKVDTAKKQVDFRLATTGAADTTGAKRGQGAQRRSQEPRSRFQPNQSNHSHQARRDNRRSRPGGRDQSEHPRRDNRPQQPVRDNRPDQSRGGNNRPDPSLRSDNRPPGRPQPRSRHRTPNKPPHPRGPRTGGR